MQIIFIPLNNLSWNMLSNPGKVTRTPWRLQTRGWLDIKFHRASFCFANNSIHEFLINDAHLVFLLDKLRRLFQYLHFHSTLCCLCSPVFHAIQLFKPSEIEQGINCGNHRDTLLLPSHNSRLTYLFIRGRKKKVSECLICWKDRRVTWRTWQKIHSTRRFV